MIENFPLFSVLGERDRVVLRMFLHTRRFPRHATVVSEVDVSRALYLILDGRVKLCAGECAGKAVVPCIHGPGEYFGEMSLFDDAPRPVCVTTLEPARIAMLTRDDLLRCLQIHPGIALALIGELVGRVWRLSEEVRALSVLDACGRLTRLLTTLAEFRDGELIIERRPTHQEMARRIGISREMVTRILGDLVRQGRVRLSGGRLILDERLQER